jgi:predicted ArsR family transcriptional regulator
MGITGFSDKQQKILQSLVREKNGMTVYQFSRLLGISRNATHQHVVSLERDGYIKKHELLQTKGRPGTTFVLTEKGIHLLPKHYSLFAEMLVSLIKKKSGSNELIDYLQELGVAISATKKELLRNEPLDKKIEMTVDIMQELGYNAQLTMAEEGQLPMIDAYNCVYHNLAHKNQEICELDLSLLTSLLDSKIEHQCCMVKGDSLCRFKVLKASD